MVKFTFEPWVASPRPTSESVPTSAFNGDKSSSGACGFVVVSTMARCLIQICAAESAGGGSAFLLGDGPLHPIRPILMKSRHKSMLRRTVVLLMKLYSFIIRQSITYPVNDNLLPHGRRDQLWYVHCIELALLFAG